jgi:hypothetical protein
VVHSRQEPTHNVGGAVRRLRGVLRICGRQTAAVILGDVQLIFGIFVIAEFSAIMIAGVADMVGASRLSAFVETARWSLILYCALDSPLFAGMLAALTVEGYWRRSRVPATDKGRPASA